MKEKLKYFGFIFGFILCITILVSCSKSENTAADSQKLKITTTTTMLKDLIQTIGGDKVEVINLMGEGVDPHLYNASAGDVEKLANADVIIYGGLHLEGKMSDVFGKLENSGKDVLDVGNTLDKSLRKKIFLIPMYGLIRIYGFWKQKLLLRNYRILILKIKIIICLI